MKLTTLVAAGTAAVVGTSTSSPHGSLGLNIALGSSVDNLVDSLDRDSGLLLILIVA